jgi:hypothetical protein
VAESNGTFLAPPPVREAVTYADTRLLVDTWQRWMTQWWQQHTVLWKQGQGGTWQPLDPTLTALAALTGTADTFPYFSGTDVMALAGLSPYSRSLLTQATAGTWRSTLGLGTLSTANAPLTVAQGGTGATDAATARTNLGLGTLSTLNSPLTVADGGTGATTAAQARTNLGLGTLSTVNAPLPVAQGGTGATDAGTARTNLGLGTMAVQHATSVAITGGTATFTGLVQGLVGYYVPDSVTANVLAFNTNLNGGSGRFAIWASGTAAAYIAGPMGVGTAPVAGANQLIVGTGNLFVTTTAYKPGGGPFLDSSRRALKTDIAAIPQALALLLAQQGRQFRWTEPLRARQRPGLQYGFIDDEVTLPQWRDPVGPDGCGAIGAVGFEALAIEAFRELTQRLEALEELRP